MRSRGSKLLLAALVLFAVPVLAQEAPRSPTPAASKPPWRQVDVAQGLENPWGLAFLPDGRMLVTERPGRLRIVEPRRQAVRSRSTGVPEVRAGGQGGLLDVALSPTFDQDRLVYLSFSEPGDGGAGTAVARGRLGERGLEGTQTIWRQQPKAGSSIHWGSRLVFRSDGTLFVTLGDRGTASTRKISPPPSARSSASTPTGRFPATTRSRAATASGRRSGRTATATSRPRRSTRAASCGRWSTARAAATS